MTDKLQITRSGELEHWTINDPATRNALSEEVVDTLMKACERVAQDEALRFVVLQGSGPSFCAGGSLSGFARSIGQALPAGETDPLVAMNAGFGALLNALCALPQILLVAVDGPALGGGLGLVCCGDFVLATSRAVFATPEVTLGVVPAQIAPFVHRRLGDRVARQMMLSGQRISAVQALACGLVDEVNDNLSVAVANRISELRRAAPRAVAHAKSLLSLVNQAEAPDFAVREAIKFAANLRSAEAAEGLTAFTQKRKPGWAA